MDGEEALVSSRVPNIDNDLIGMDSLPACAKGKVERQKLNQTAARPSFDRVFSVQLDTPIKTIHPTRMPDVLTFQEIGKQLICLMKNVPESLSYQPHMKIFLNLTVNCFQLHNISIGDFLFQITIWIFVLIIFSNT